MTRVIVLRLLIDVRETDPDAAGIDCVLQSSMYKNHR